MRDNNSSPRGRELIGIPAPGQVSRDQVAIMGLGGFAFLYKGTNDYYGAYWDLRLHEFGEHFVTITRQRNSRFVGRLPFGTLLVPNKGSCLHNLYPMLKPRRFTTAWEWANSRLSPADRVAMCDSLMKPAGATAMWRSWDSHWSPLGTLQGFSELLGLFDLAAPSDVRRARGFVEHFGDLGNRWGENHFCAPDVWDLEWDRPDPRRVFDNGHDGLDHVHLGRRVSWEQEDPTLDAHLCIVGNSFSGVGTKMTHLTWWAARYFAKVTFIHNAGIPTDVLERVDCDLLAFQTIERFIRQPMMDDLDLDAMDRAFEARVS